MSTNSPRGTWRRAKCRLFHKYGPWEVLHGNPNYVPRHYLSHGNPNYVPRHYLSHGNPNYVPRHYLSPLTAALRAAFSGVPKNNLSKAPAEAFGPIRKNDLPGYPLEPWDGLL